MTQRNKDQLNSIDAYFSFGLWDQKIMKNIEIFKTRFHSSFQDKKDKFKDIIYVFWDFNQ